MNTLDSRWLRHGDTFLQKFSRTGRYTYDFGQLPKGRGRFTIEVKERTERKEPQQHYVAVRREKDGRTLSALPRELSIEAGDVVLWSAAGSSVPGFSVNGWSDTDASFSSAALTREAVYTHAFGSAGVFQWRDARNERIRGTVAVAAVETDNMERLRERLAEGTVVLIRGDEVSPAEVKIIAGQTVFFAVEQAEGITITDARLLGMAGT